MKKHIYAAAMLLLFTVQAFGAQWTVMPDFPMPARLSGLWGPAADDIYAVSQEGYIFHYNGSAWSQMTQISYPLHAVWGSSGASVYAVGNAGTIVYYNGISWSSRLASPTIKNLYSISGGALTDMYVSGETGTLLHYNGTGWNSRTSGINDLNSIWRAGANDVFAAGQSGTILHYNGSLWSGMASNTAEHLNALWGSATNNVFAAGENGAIVHYNGTTWSAMASATPQHLNALWGPSAGGVYAVGDNGAILYYDGSTWSAMASNTNRSLYSVWGFSGGPVYAVGENGTVLRYAPDNGSSTTTAATTTTTTIAIPGSMCPFSTFAARNTGTAQGLRRLRNDRVTSAMGAYLAALYYRNAPEITDILWEDPAFRRRFVNLTDSGFPALGNILHGRAAVVSAGTMDKVHTCLVELQERGSVQLAMDIDFVLRGIESGWLTEWLGVTIEQ